MWESHGFSECANGNVLVASDGTGGSRDTHKCLRKVAFGVATFSLHVLSRTTFEVQRIGFLCWSGARQTHCSSGGTLGSHSSTQSVLT